MKRILCIDGGGMRGLIPAVVLAELERKAKKPCHEIFDLISGTSIGGIL
ncbi:MAG: patatin-like phospholipase family protein, partial [Verrucomicrobia bacterium]|nr:patatin-like phospholipase family protein [Verrucomicrobiota bacterium]